MTSWNYRYRLLHLFDYRLGANIQPSFTLIYCKATLSIYCTSYRSSQTDGTSQRQTPGSLSRTPVSLETPDSLEAGIHQVSSDNDEEQKSKALEPRPWEYSSKRTRYIQVLIAR